jgi:hypothetical protein
MTQPSIGHAGALRSRLSAKPHFFETRMWWRSVLIRLDTRCRGVIISLELTDGGGVAIPLVIERTKRECCNCATFLWLPSELHK